MTAPSLPVQSRRAFDLAVIEREGDEAGRLRAPRLLCQGSKPRFSRTTGRATYPQLLAGRHTADGELPGAFRELTPVKCAVLRPLET